MKRILHYSLFACVHNYFYLLVSIGSLAPKEMLSAKFGLRRNSTDSLNCVVIENQAISSELDTIAEEEEDTNTAHT